MARNGWDHGAVGASSGALTLIFYKSHADCSGFSTPDNHYGSRVCDETTRQPLAYGLVDDGCLRPWPLDGGPSRSPGAGVVLNWSNWFFSSGSRIGLYFQITKTNWGIIIALLAVHVAFLFTSGAEQDFKKDYVFWLVEAGEIALTFAVLASADLWSLILSWTALDVCILAYELLIRKNTQHEKLLHISIAKVVGILLLMFNTALISSRGGNLLLTAIPGSSSAFICLVAFLHSGVLPFYSFESNKLDHRSILDFFSFLLPFISSLFLITYLPGHQLSFFLGLVLKLYVRWEEFSISLCCGSMHPMNLSD
jgi:hypothetical protein